MGEDVAGKHVIYCQQIPPVINSYLVYVPRSTWRFNNGATQVPKQKRHDKQACAKEPDTERCLCQRSFTH